MIRYYIIVDGRVQGVGFRFFCTMNARTLDLTGWVRNMDNGMVEMEVQGEESSIEKFIRNIKKGNKFILFPFCKAIDFNQSIYFLLNTIHFHLTSS